MPAIRASEIFVDQKMRMKLGAILDITLYRRILICVTACDHFNANNKQITEQHFLRISTRKAIKHLTIIEPSKRFDSFNFSIFGCEKSQTHSHFYSIIRSMLNCAMIFCLSFGTLLNIFGIQLYIVHRLDTISRIRQCTVYCMEQSHGKSMKNSLWIYPFH